MERKTAGAAIDSAFDALFNRFFSPYKPSVAAPTPTAVVKSIESPSLTRPPPPPPLALAAPQVVKPSLKPINIDRTKLRADVLDILRDQKVSRYYFSN